MLFYNESATHHKTIHHKAIQANKEYRRPTLQELINLLNKQKTIIRKNNI